MLFRSTKGYIKVNSKHLTLSVTGNYIIAIRFYTKDYTFIHPKDELLIGFALTEIGNVTIPIPSNAYYYTLVVSNIDYNNATISISEIIDCGIQLEEGTTATAYEPHKEYTKTLYLNSPLLEGDTIEEKDGGIYHVHRYKKVVLDGSDDEEWILSTVADSVSIPRFNCKMTEDIIRWNEISIPNIICDKFKTITFNRLYSSGDIGISSLSDRKSVV